jgi:hypothetical protein
MSRSRQLKNVRIHEGDARDVVGWLPDASVDRLFIMFPDPWHKARHNKRRLIQPAFVAELARVLKPGAAFRFATDWADYAEWTVERVLADPAFRFADEAADRNAAPADHVTTRYEEKKLGDCAPVFLDFVLGLGEGRRARLAAGPRPTGAGEAAMTWLIDNIHIVLRDRAEAGVEIHLWRDPGRAAGRPDGPGLGIPDRPGRGDDAVGGLPPRDADPGRRRGHRQQALLHRRAGRPPEAVPEGLRGRDGGRRCGHGGVWALAGRLAGEDLRGLAQKRGARRPANSPFRITW